MLVTFSEDIAFRIMLEVRSQLASLPRRRIAAQALQKSRVIIASSPAEAVAIANAYAPEHLIVQVEKPRALLSKITTAGSVFLGAWTPESLGDYASGTNHVLPTYGWARACSGLGLVDFQRTMTVQEASAAGLQRLGPIVERLALAEGLVAHQRAVSLRLPRIF
jgi:histidinol dehydrogenase